MAQIVKLRRSSVSGQKPTNTTLQLGELALNTVDGKVFFAKSGSLGPTVEELVSTNTTNTGSVNISGSINLIGTETISGSLQISGSGFLNSHRILTDLDTGSMGLINSIQFNTSSNISVKPGELAWNNTDGTLDLGMKGGNVVQQIGQEIFYEVRNETGIEIPNGTAVYANGVTAGSGRITVAPYVADGSVREVRFLGVATENISTGVNGFVTYFGYIRGLDTRGTTASSIAVGDETWAVGDILYVHPTVAGKLTKVKPQHEVTVAIVITRHQSAGVIFVRPTSSGHLEDIHDISINTGSLTNGQVLMYNNINGLWENNNNFTGSFIGDGSQLYNIPLSGVTNLTTISSSFDSRINTITGSITNIFSDIDSLQFYTGALNNFTSSFILDTQTSSMTVLSASFATTASVNASGASLIGGTGTANYLAKFTAAGTVGDSLIFDNGTNVLIGTTSTPTPVVGVVFPLTVTSANTTRIRIDSTQATPNSGFGLYANSVQKWSIAMFGATSDFTIYNDALLASAILVKGGSSNVLVGTTTDAGFKLDVNGSGRFSGALTTNLTATRIPFIGTGGVLSDDAGLSWDNVNKRLGVGLTNPAVNIEIRGASNSNYLRLSGDDANGARALDFTSFEGGGFNGAGHQINAKSQFGVLSFATNSTERMRITASGRVLIGSPPPTESTFQLDVNGTGRFSGDLTATNGTFITTATTGTTELLVLSRNASGWGRTSFKQSYDSTYFTNGKTLTLANDANIDFAHFAGNNAGTITNFILPTGNVGIGTTSPDLGKLQLSGVNGVTFAIKNTAPTTTGSEFSQIVFNSTSNANANFESAKIKVVSTNGGVNLANLIFENSGSERMRITSGGNILINTTADAGFRLDVNGTGAFTSTSSGAATNVLTIRNSGSAVVNTEARLFLSTVLADNRGAYISAIITSASNDNALVLATNAAGASPTERWRIGSTGILQSNGSQTIQTSTGNLTLATAGGNGNIILTPHGTGNVGIGTSSPAARLQVIDGSSAQPALSVIKSSSNGQAALSVTHDTTSAGRIVADFRNSAGSVAIINGAGNVGIGTTLPSASLDVRANNVVARFQSDINAVGTSIHHTGGSVASIGFQGSTSTNNFNVRVGADGNDFIAYTNNTERMRITSNGNVGIGTTSPVKNLEVYQATDGATIRISSGQNNAAHVTTTPFGILEFYSADASSPGASVRSSIGSYPIDAAGSGGANLIFNNSNSGGIYEAMRITSVGNVLVGTTTDAGFKLDVNGTGRFSGNLVTSAGFAINANNGTLSVSPSSTRGIINLGGTTDNFLTFSDKGYIGQGSNYFQILARAGAALSLGSNNADVLNFALATGAATFSSTVSASSYLVGATSVIDANRTVLLGNGAVGTPALRFSGDTNTGIYWISADTIGISTAGVLRLTMTAGGAMGLGVTPTNTLGRFEASNDVVAFSSSDKRWKTNIANIDSSLSKVSKINGVYFDWIEDEPIHGNKGKDYGVIAQEVEELFPEMVTTRDNGMKAVKYDRLIPVLIEAVKELNMKIKTLEDGNRNK